MPSGPGRAGKGPEKGTAGTLSTHQPHCLSKNKCQGQALGAAATSTPEQDAGGYSGANRAHGHPSGDGGPALRLHPGQPHAQALPRLQGKKLQSRAAAAGDAMWGLQLPGVRLPPACPEGVPASCPGPPHPSRAPPLAPSKTLPREASSWEELKAACLVLFRILVFAPRKELPPSCHAAPEKPGPASRKPCTAGWGRG